MTMREIARTKMYEAMKNHDTEAKTTWSMLLQALEKKEKDKMATLTEADELSVLDKELKAYRETADYAQKANRIAAYTEAMKSIELLTPLKPKMMSEDEIKMEIANVYATGEYPPLKANKGKIMKSLSYLKGKADMKLVNKLVDESLI